MPILVLCVIASILNNAPECALSSEMMFKKNKQAIILLARPEGFRVHDLKYTFGGRLREAGVLFKER